ncbi:MAG TPA: DNA replication/repair protein RecF [Pseudogracilibacillus sp.]|nr:DNA replication/repair protein RecF [Pseudogracilibacillus sp.]
MFINELKLKNFRNYEQLDLTFDSNVNVIIGENAQGKTNMLEAIYLLAFTKSYRTNHDRELIKWDEEFAKINANLQKKNRSIPLELIFHKNGKKAKVNHIEQQKLSEFIGHLNVVMFAPEDLALVKGAPQMRRRFIDMELGQIEPLYLYHLGEYQKILKQRNSHLKQLQKQRHVDRTLLDILTEQLIAHATLVLHKRFQFLQLLREWAVPIHEKISRGLELLRIDYVSTIEVLEDASEETIESSYSREFERIVDNEIYRGTTLIGPHRDDLAFFINEKDVKLYGSQGQQRTTALSLKLAEIDLIYEQINEYPILLLDDVLSELDDYRQSHLLTAIQDKVQTFVSTTSVDGINHETLRQATMYVVTDGEVETTD